MKVLSFEQWVKRQWFILDAETNKPLRDILTNEIIFNCSKQESIEHLYWIPFNFKAVEHKRFSALSAELRQEFIKQCHQ